MTGFEPLQVLTFPLRIIGAEGLMMTIGLFYVSCVLFFGYMFVILDFTARGHQQPPMLKECLLISMLLALIYFIKHPYWQLLTSIAMLILLPVVTSLLIIYDSLFAALNPLNWVGMVRQVQMGPRMLHYL
ncbi:MAG: hypothetical protein ACJATP_002293 [Candidatus Azotimanducaceae bacterium]|jgi:hypothetical protein